MNQGLDGSTPKAASLGMPRDTELEFQNSDCTSRGGSAISDEQDKRDPADDLSVQLRQLLKQIEDAPVSEELRLAAKKLGIN